MGMGSGESNLPPMGGDLKSSFNNPNLGLRSRIQGLDPDSRILKGTVWTHRSFLKWLQISPGLEGVGEVKYKHGHVCLSTD